MGSRLNKQTSWFIFLALIYLLCIGAKFGYYHAHPIITSYLSDLLAMPLIHLASTFGIRWIKRRPNFNLSLSQIWAGTVYVCVVFEGFLPYVNDRYTQDFLDIVMYLIGTLFFIKVLWKK